MGLNLEQLQNSLGIVKDYSDTELTESERRISALIQALYEVIEENKQGPLQIDDGVGIEDTPVGHILTYMGKKAPRHYLICDGTVYNIADYPMLSQHILEEFGSVNYFGGDGTTTFAVPDLRGEFLRGTGINSHANQGSGGDVGTHQNATKLPYIYSWRENSNGAVYGGFQTGTAKTYTPTDTDYKFSNGNRVFVIQDRNLTVSGITTEFTVRPTNTAVLYCIKYEPTYYLRVGPDAKVFHQEETRIGTWYDGKPLYRKFFFHSGVLTSTTKIPAVIPNLVDVVNIRTSISQGREWILSAPYTSANEGRMLPWYEYTTSTISFVCDGQYTGKSNTNVVVELWYTKPKTS